VMLTGGVDLSVATTATAGAFITSGTAHAQGTGTALLLALGLGFGIGLVNGVGVAIFRVNPLIMTLGLSSVTLGALTIYSQKRFVALVPNLVNTFGSGRFFKYVPYDLLVWAPIAALIILGLRHSGFGRMVYAVGDNPLACRLAGVRVWQVLLLVYALCGAFSALAGILLVGFNDAADLGIAAPFLGRDPELRLLKELFHTAVDRQHLRYSLQDHLAVKRAFRHIEIRVELVKEPSKSVLNSGSLADEIVAVVE